MPNSISICADLLRAAQRVVLFSGAGLSTAAGVPDFRSPTGLYALLGGADPQRVFDLDAFLVDPRPYYAVHRARLRALASIQPTRTHRFFARLEADGRLLGVITQNIDGLHQQAGSKNVLEVHGSLATAHCLGCRATYSRTIVETLIEQADVARCTSCGGVIKPDVVFFGEAVRYLEEAAELVEAADLLFVVGSSLMVYPAAALPSHGTAPIVVVNRGPFAYEAIPRARLALHAEDDIDSFFAAVAERL